jgi:hypothetical protein
LLSRQYALDHCDGLAGLQRSAGLATEVLSGSLRFADALSLSLQHDLALKLRESGEDGPKSLPYWTSKLEPLKQQQNGG